MKYIYILDQNTFSLFCICILAIAKIYIQKNKQQRKKYIMRETSTGPQQKSRACSLQGPLAASPAEIWTRIRWPRLDIFACNKIYQCHWWDYVFFWGGRSCTVSSKQSSWRNAALGLGKTLAMAMDGLDDGVSNSNEGSFIISNTNNFVFGLEYLSTSVFHQPQYIAILPGSLESL